MKEIKIICRIHHPEHFEEITVKVYATLAEAIKALGKQDCLDAINREIIFSSRLEWRNNMMTRIATGQKLKQ
jgi:hypothetical protein